MHQQESSSKKETSTQYSVDQTIVILGGGGHASDVMSIIESLRLDDEYRILVADDSPTRDRFDGRNASMVSPIDDHLHPGQQFVSGVGYPGARKTLVQRAEDAGLKAFPALVHPTTVVATGVSLGAGAVVGGLAYLSPLTVLGGNCYVGYGAKIGHDTVIGERTSVMPGAFVAGDTQVGAGVLIGANATVLQGLSIGDGAVVGAGAVVTKDVPAGATVTGVPAKTCQAHP